MFLDNEYLSKLLYGYSLYDINFASDTKNFEFLINDMSYIVDKYIEIGEYNLIKNNISLLNSSSLMIIKRCIFNKEINEPIINKDGKLFGSLRKEENYYLSDNELNESIIENSTDIIPLEINDILKKYDSYIVTNITLPELDKFIINKYCYKFGDLIISKNKVLRNYTILKTCEYNELIPDNEMIFYSILYNYPNTISYNDINNIKNILNKKTKSLS